MLQNGDTNHRLLRFHLSPAHHSGNVAVVSEISWIFLLEKVEHSLLRNYVPIQQSEVRGLNCASEMQVRLENRDDCARAVIRYSNQLESHPHPELGEECCFLSADIQFASAKPVDLFLLFRPLNLFAVAPLLALAEAANTKGTSCNAS